MTMVAVGGIRSIKLKMDWLVLVRGEDMGGNKENSNRNNFNGTTNFNGPTQVAAGDIINNISGDSRQKAKYTPEPLWRSPFTLAVLSWISWAIGILGLVPVSKIAKDALHIYNGSLQTISDFLFQTCLTILTLLLIYKFLASLRKITKNETRHPLLLNYAVSGYDSRLTLERIRIEKCPQCGGRMKYYNKPVKWTKIPRNDGSIKIKVTERYPALECKRNSKHWYEVDPAEDKVQ